MFELNDIICEIRLPMHSEIQLKSATIPFVRFKSKGFQRRKVFFILPPLTLYISFYVLHIVTNNEVFSMLVCHATCREFDSRLSKVHSIFHSFGIDKMSTKLTWEQNSEGPTLGGPPDSGIYSIAPRGPGSCKLGCVP